MCTSRCIKENWDNKVCQRLTNKVRQGGLLTAILLVYTLINYRKMTKSGFVGQIDNIYMKAKWYAVDVRPL